VRFQLSILFVKGKAMVFTLKHYLKLATVTLIFITKECHHGGGWVGNLSIHGRVGHWGCTCATEDQQFKAICTVSAGQ